MPDHSTETPPTPVEPPASVPKKIGRKGVTFEAVKAVVDEWIANHGKTPSMRELRRALGGTGSATTLSRHLRDVKAGKLFEGADPERGSSEEILIRAARATMDILAPDLAEMADDVIAKGVRKADQKIAAVESRCRRMEEKAHAESLQRKHAEGQVDAMTAQLQEMKKDLVTAKNEHREVLAREVKVVEMVKELDMVVTRVNMQRNQLETHCRELESKTGAANARVVELEMKVKTEKTQRASAESARNRCRTELDKASNTITSLHQEAETATLKLQQLEINLEKTHLSRDAIQDSVNELRDQVAALVEREAVLGDISRKR